MNEHIIIKKASGDEEVFSTDKLKRSLENAGAKNETISKIATDIEAWIYPGITTKKIYSRAFSLLRRERTNSSIRYRLKQAILELGPTGYPFESFIGELFKHKGFSTEVGVVVDGQCITHEMDVIATQHSTQHLVECKYHKDQGKQVSIQVPLYVRSRVNDIISKRQNKKEYQDFSFEGWVITNTRFSSDSIDYSKCNGMNLMAWDYPLGKGLKDIIEELKIYPLTVLKHLTLKEKQFLLNEKGIVTCSQLISKTNALHELDLSKPKFNRILKELRDICA